MTIETSGAAATHDNDRQPSAKGSSNGALFGAAAAGLAVGLAANLTRKAAVQGMTVAAGSWDEALAAEHSALLKIFDAIEETEDKQKAKRSTLLMSMKHALLKHSVQEENVIYPALRDAGYVEGADQLNHEHGYIKDYTYELENMPKDSPEFLPTVRRFRAEIEKHMREEEDELYPSMKAQLDPATNKKLTLLMNKEGFKVA